MDEGFLAELGEVLVTYRGHGVVSDGAWPAVTGEMRRLRVLSLVERRTLYLQERVRARVVWYRSKVDDFTSRSNIWSLVTIGAILLGLPLAVLQFPDVPSRTPRSSGPG
ncbi:hypothetical protein ABUW04_33385 [Streptacidiphilus sp. N1-10]|uniref:SMODS and SLOG-associating 2TM effector domain-containing protein n=1 Tax=Streptacidiphilus jeojiensis TaxID=3229225 RepID=A0ABV6XXZ3_9ACTN